MTAPRRFEPTLDRDRLEDLRQRVGRACREAEARPQPSAAWEMDKARLGLTHARHRQLLFAWRDFLGQGEDKNTGEGQHNGHASTGSASRPGADHDTWQAFEKRLSSFQHYASDIEDIHVHFIWERAATDAQERRPIIPLVLLHGWPSSVADFFNVIHPLAHPGTSAPSHVPAFDVVVPSQTGYLWSSSPKVDNFGRGQHGGPQGDLLLSDQARIVHKLMLSLGYRRYAIQAGDWGAALSRHMARLYPKNVVALHLNFCPAGPPSIELPIVHRVSHWVPQSIKDLAWNLTPTPVARTVHSLLTYPIWRARLDYAREPGPSSWLAHYLLGFPRPLDLADRKKIRRAYQFTDVGSAYANMQGSRSSTLGLALEADPAALLAWIGEKYIEWTEDDLEDAEMCAQLTLYWCTDTMARSIYNYRNRPSVNGQLPITDHTLDIRQPFGMTDYPYEILPAPLDWMKRTGNLRWYRKRQKGGHFVAMERPTEYVEDVRDCIGQLWRP